MNLDFHIYQLASTIDPGFPMPKFRNLLDSGIKTVALLYVLVFLKRTPTALTCRLVGKKNDLFTVSVNKRVWSFLWAELDLQSVQGISET